MRLTRVRARVRLDILLLASAGETRCCRCGASFKGACAGVAAGDAPDTLLVRGRVRVRVRVRARVSLTLIQRATHPRPCC